MTAASTIPSGSTVLVTGITGYIGAHVAETFLKAGYKVRGTLRNPAKAQSLADRWNKNGFADRFEFAVVADLLTENGFADAVKGVSAVAHVASPVTFAATDPYKDVIDPAVQGTLSLLRAAKQSPSVKRVVVTSSAVSMFQTEAGHTYTEADWNEWSSAVVAEKGNAADGLAVYCASKTEAERAAWKFVETEKPGFTLAVINPVFVWGPPVTASNAGLTVSMIYSLIDGTAKTIGPETSYTAAVDVRDVAQAHLEAIVRPEASGRYLLSASATSWKEISDILHELYPDRPIPALDPSAAPVKQDVLNGVKAAKELGIQYVPLKTTIKDMLDFMISAA